MITQFPDYFVRFLPTTDDEQLILLKGYLIIEEVLTKIICDSFKKPIYVKDANLTFHQKIQLVRACKLKNTNDWYWDGLHSLNNAMSAFNHNSEKDLIKDKISSFVGTVLTKSERIPQNLITKTTTRLHWAIFLLFGGLTSSSNTVPADLSFFNHAKDTIWQNA